MKKTYTKDNITDLQFTSASNNTIYTILKVAGERVFVEWKGETYKYTTDEVLNYLNSGRWAEIPRLKKLDKTNNPPIKSPTRI